jgi:predicted TIM-barrel fold metal-dependent hydrolase
MTTALARRLDGVAADAPVVDCDLHVAPASEAALVAHLPDRFREKGVAYPDGNWANPVGDAREGTAPDDGPPGSSPALTREQHLDPLGLDYAVITGGRPNLRASALPDRRYAAALTRAYNDWLAETWLDADERFLGSVSVSPVAPEAGAGEIRRLGDRPDVVQVVTGAATRIPLGRERHWPVYEAAAEADLPVAVHAGAEGYGVSNPNTGAGYPSTYLERRSVAPANLMGQLLDLVFEGPFVEFPDLRIVFVGGGYGWVPSFLWRLDKNWKGLREDFPWVERPPSEYVREHVRFATHPLDETGDPERTAQMLEMVDAEETVLFGSNYPRWESYAPGDPLPELEPALASAVFSETPAELYGL